MQLGFVSIDSAFFIHEIKQSPPRAAKVIPSIFLLLLKIPVMPSSTMGS